MENDAANANKQMIEQDIEDIFVEMGFQQEEIKNLIDGIHDIIEEADIPELDIKDIRSDEGLQNAVEHLSETAKNQSPANRQNLAGEYIALMRALGKERIAQIKLVKNEWLPRSIDEFKKVMPAIETQYPEVYHVTRFNVEQVLVEISEKIRARIECYDNNAKCEYFHGEDGDALIIYLDHLKTVDYTSLALDVWSCLGRFYAINYEPKEWFNKYEFKSYDSSAKCCGYQFWSFFVGFTIANVIYNTYNKPYEADRFKEWLTWSLGQAFSEILSDYRESDLSHIANYFASLLTFKCAEIDDCISTVPSVAQPFLQEMKVILTEQMKKEQFWITDEEILEKIGDLALRMYSEWDASIIRARRAIANKEKQKEDKAKKKARKEAKKSRNRNRKK